MGLEEYGKKRSFDKTSEPEGRVEHTPSGNLYVIQKHAASRLHYDLRLELDGVLKSWAVPKGPSLKAGEKRLAVHVEDHPVGYGSFEGIIPEGEYGGGTVMLWDRGTWAPIGDPQEGFLRGDLKFDLHGEKLKGSWVLARMKGRAGEEGKNWLLIKKRDEASISGTDPEPVETLNRSVSSGRTMEEIRGERKTFQNEGESVPQSGAAFEAAVPPPGAHEETQPESLGSELATPTGYEAKDVHYIRPELAAAVEFSDWTEEGILRRPSLKGLREDRDPAGKFEPSRGNPAGPNLTNPDRVLYPEIGITKKALADYYADIADWILPHLKGRPLTLVRCPRGRAKECFFQKHLGDSAPRALRSIKIMGKDGYEYYSVADDAGGLTALAQMGALEIHVWGSREDRLELPDMMIFDLDPAPDVRWAEMIEAARMMRLRLCELGLTSFVKATGGKGLHIVAPLTPKADWNTVGAFSKAVADTIVREAPGKYIATMSKKKRKGKIFIDYLRNGRGATSIAAYSTRNRPGAPIAIPLSWDELVPGGLKSDSCNIHNIRRRLMDLTEDPWAGYFSVRQEITDEMKKRVGI